METNKQEGSEVIAIGKVEEIAQSLYDQISEIGSSIKKIKTKQGKVAKINAYSFRDNETNVEYADASIGTNTSSLRIIKRNDPNKKGIKLQMQCLNPSKTPQIFIETSFTSYYNGTTTLQERAYDTQTGAYEAIYAESFGNASHLPFQRIKPFNTSISSLVKK